MSPSSPLRLVRTIGSATPDQTGPSLPQPTPGLSLQVTPLTATPAGARLVTSPASCLVVGAAPVAEAEALLVEPAFQGPTCYGLAHQGMLDALGVDGNKAPQLKVGETLRTPGRYADHRTQPPLPFEEIVLIGSRDRENFGRDAVVALQEILTERAAAAGRYEVIGATPTRSWLRQVRPELVARWLADLRPMLVSAGWLMFEPRGALLLPRGRLIEAPAPQAAVALPPPAEPPAVPAGFSTAFPPDLLRDARAERFSLQVQGASARVCVVNAWIILEKGSLIRRRDRAGIQPCLARKRRQLIGQGLLRRSGRQDFLRLTQDVALPSLTNAARVVTGANTPKTRWVRA